MKPLVLDGIIYDKDGIDALLAVMIEVRDSSLMGNDWKVAVIFSQVIAVLNYYKEQLDHD
jgi:hypothetical protein